MRRLITIILVGVLLAACGGKRAEQKAIRQESDSLMAAYHHSDSIYAVCGRIDTAAFESFIVKATEFAKKHPDDSLAPGMFYRAGVGSMILSKYADRMGNVEERARNAKRALNIFNQFQEQYPDLEQAKLCYWQRAIVYDDILGDWRSAESEYRDFINRYPNDSLTPVFQQYLSLLGKTESQLEEELAIGR